MNPSPLGATVTKTGVDFAVWSKHASLIELCLFDENGEKETKRLAMARDSNDVHRLSVPGIGNGARYGYRAHGVYSPDHGLWYDPAKLLVDPYAIEIDQPFRFDPALSVFGADTAARVPKAIIKTCRKADLTPPLFDPSGLIYEVAVKSLTMRHPAIDKDQRGTLAALAHPAMIAHFKRLGVSAVELMPITAWIDERHLKPLNLTNGWGYNPVTMMALDPRLVPGGMEELCHTVECLHENGIGVILDLVFNHTGESDRFGPTLSLRGLDNLGYYRHLPSQPGTLVNDTGCGNTLAADFPAMHRLIIDSLHHFVLHAGIDGFRFDLATILGRTAKGFDQHAALFRAIHSDPVLEHRVMFAEPWDIGPGGYQLGNFPAPFFEWNDRARDDMRMFWRGDRNKIGVLANALAGSSDIFSRHKEKQTRTVNFLAAHDGFTLADLVSYSAKHNSANGEHNRDGHDENHSWNNGVEGETTNPEVLARRKADRKALISTLFASRGAILLTAGDEMGRSQKGNNNAYAQDNEITWLDWETADAALIEHVARLALIRARFEVFSRLEFFAGKGDVTWLNKTGQAMQVADWQDPQGNHVTMVLQTADRHSKQTVPIAVAFNRSIEALTISLPGEPEGWTPMIGTGLTLAPRSVSWFLGKPANLKALTIQGAI